MKDVDISNVKNYDILIYKNGKFTNSSDYINKVQIQNILQQEYVSNI